MQIINVSLAKAQFPDIAVKQNSLIFYKVGTLLLCVWSLQCGTQTIDMHLQLAQLIKELPRSIMEHDGLCAIYVSWHVGLHALVHAKALLQAAFVIARSHVNLNYWRHYAMRLPLLVGDEVLYATDTCWQLQIQTHRHTCDEQHILCATTGNSTLSQNVAKFSSGQW